MFSNEDPVNLVAEEKTTITLEFAEPAKKENYTEIRWYKGSRNSSDEIVFYHPNATESRPLYKVL